jgi:hypothetical protein
MSPHTFRGSLAKYPLQHKATSTPQDEEDEEEEKVRVQLECN